MARPSGPALVRVADPAALARAAAEEVARRAEAAVAARGRFAIALAGGSTPRALYGVLADPAAPWRARVPWARTEVWFGDERCVPPDHPDSNYRMAREALLDRVAPAAVHRIEGERPPADAAARYEAALRQAAGAAGEPPRLDLVLLGLGADGHTASLFPDSPALRERARWVAAPFVPAVGAHRVTLTLPVLERARAIAFLVSGAGKRAALERLLAAGPPAIPAARVRPLDGALLVLADDAALG
ncbi:6-phosphogluconolactonase [Anaeromyxobacter dehalogenans]|uniref:6-phosphogluconolactonase n=1 Tax=Anaeromyxobacter dehalogenans (strain 2CP-C) TaxID=290397 RepID=Q2IHT3_ANADE|nr:6-phosphogluconolactonase [Anaeromyxobacter dehalogenans]ABC81213.1 6-phosphogluconolactonase [Anaeromyxobacter dehalogenans 2CP-C]